METLWFEIKNDYFTPSSYNNNLFKVWGCLLTVLHFHLLMCTKRRTETELKLFWYNGERERKRVCVCLELFADLSVSEQ